MNEHSEDNQKVAIIGTSGSGKTCFIAAMRWLGDGGENTRFISVGANGDSKKYLDDLNDKVKVGKVPRGTPSEFKLEFSEQYVLCPGQSPIQINFSMRDFKGGVLHDLDSSSDLLQSWTHCDLLMVLLDVEKVQKQGIDLHDNLRDLSAVLIRDEMGAGEKRLAIVITQADKGGFTEDRHSSEEAEKFIVEQLSIFFERVKKCGFKEIKCFALASIGYQPEKCDDGENRVPEIEGMRKWRPYGYDEIFDWICTFRQKDERAQFLAKLWKQTKPLVSVLSVFTFAGVIWLGVVVSRRQAALSTYQNLNSTLEQKADATWKMSETDSIHVIENRIRDYKDSSEKVSVDELRDLVAEINRFFGLKENRNVKGARISEEQRKRVAEIVLGIANRLEDTLFEQIKGAIDNGDGEVANDLITRYQKDSEITKNHKDEVNEYKSRLCADERAKAKLEIVGCDVGDPRNVASMKRKLEKILAFTYPEESDKNEAVQSVKAMQKLMRGTFKISRINAGGLEKSRNSFVMMATRIATNKDLKEYLEEGQGIAVKTESVDSMCPQWSGDDIGNCKDLNWSPGESIRVEWRWNPSMWPGSYIMASVVSIDDWLGLLKILQPRIEMQNEAKGKFESTPTITITCKEFPDPETDLRLITRYVYPGTYWTE